MNFSKKNNEYKKQINKIVSKTTILKTVLFIFALTLVNCTKNDDQDQLPPITQTGANTFGAIVDGRVFIPKDKTGYYNPGGGRPKGISILRGTSYFSIAVSNYEDVYIYIYIPKNVPLETTYTFKLSDGNPANGNEPHCFAVINNTGYLSYENSGTIAFTKIDEIKGIIAGTFSLKMKNRNNENNIIEITDGRFDI